MKLLRSTLLVCLLIIMAIPLIAQQDFLILHKSGDFIPPANAGQFLNRNNSVQANAANWRHQLVQFYTIPNSQQRKEMEATGIRFVEYLPHNAYVIAFPKGYDPARLRQADIRSVTDIQASLKIHPMLAELPVPAWTERPGGKAAITITYYPTLSPETAQRLILPQYSTSVLHNAYARTLEVIVPISEIRKIAAIPAVQYLEPIDPDPQPENYSGRTLHRSNSIATESSFAGGRKYDGSGVVIAMGDDGPIGPHIDYHGRTDQSHVSSNNGNHGDHVAGTIMGSGNLNPKHKGMAYGAVLHVYSVWNAVNQSPTSHVADQVMITSTSYSNGCNAGYTSFARSADQSIRQNPALLHVFSAGNNGTSDCGYGAGTGWGNVTGGVKVGKNVLAVANVNASGTIVSSSSRGPAADGRIKPEVSAKGTSVTSPVDDNQYATFTGTSMSCPGVSGVTGQLYHAYRSLNNNNDPESALIKGILMNTATDAGNSGPDFKYGYGIVNAFMAVKNLEEGRYMFDQVDQGDTISHTINVPVGTAQLRVMLNWTDFEGSSGASIALVNNLDMQVTDPGMTVYDPWILDPSPSATLLNNPATRGVDNLNNMEQVTLDAPAPGAYQVQIAGKSVPQGPQKYWITYELLDSSLTLTYPIGGEPFRPGESELLRWDAHGDWGTFDGEYSLDSGVTWVNMFTAGPATSRQYSWSVPNAATGNARIRITRGADSDMGEAPFDIIGVPGGLKVLRACQDYIVLKWNYVSTATGYEVSMLGAEYMDSIGVTSADSFTVTGLNATDSYFFSVKSLGPDKAIGRRAIAVEKVPGVWNCLDPNDVEITQILAPGNGAIQSCTDPSNISVRIELENKSPNSLTNFPVSYKFDGGTTVTETYTDTLLGYATDEYTFSTATVTLGLGNHNVIAWVVHPADLNNSNDTLTSNTSVSNNTLLKTLPYSQDFETFSNCPTSSNCGATNCTMVDGWHNLQNLVDDDLDWRTHSGNTPTNSSGPSSDHNPGTPFGRYLYTEASQCLNREALLLSPCIDLTAAIDPELNFWFHLFGDDMGELHVDIYANGQWDYDVSGVMGSNWFDKWWERKIDLTPYLGNIITVRWRGVTGSGVQSDMALDDINFIENYVGIEEDILANDIKVFPNPGTGLFNITVLDLQSREIEMRVIDIHGREVFHQVENTQTGSFNGSIDLSYLPAGIYTLQIVAKGKRQSIKISKI